MTNQPLESAAPHPARHYVCGTLNYTLRSLILVCIWLMIGGMTLSLFTMLPGRMLPVKLQELGASDFQNSIILAVIGSTLNIVICPIVSFRSDRYRSRWGRRIPFMLMSLPFISLSLILFGFGDQIGSRLAAATAGWAHIAPATMTITVLALVMFMFQFANMYVNSVFWYIFNDVIPVQFFGRVMGAFQVASNAAIAAFNLFVFKYAEPFHTEIFVVSGILYAIGMGLMCIMIKEGEYPPVTGENGSAKRAWYMTLWMFLRESCCSRFYILRYTLTTVLAIAGSASVFTYFYNKEMGLDDNLIGRMDGLSGICIFLATLGITTFGSFLVDRWHPMRIYIYWALFAAAGNFNNWKWIFGVLPNGSFCWITIVLTIGTSFLWVFNSIATLPMEMLTLPKSRFGSFCSAQALIRALFGTLFSLLVGGIFDLLRVCFPVSPTFNYRFVPLWSELWFIPAAIIAYIVYREWNKLGGYKHYQAPASWSPTGKEPVFQPESHLPSAQWLKLALFGFDGILLLMEGGILFLSWWAYHREMRELAFHLLYWALPLQTAVCWVWWKIRSGILNDLKRVLRKQSPRNGIPHHGLLLLVALRQLVFGGVGLYEVLLIGQEGGFAFVLSEIGACFVLVLTIYAAARMERGIVTEVVPGFAARLPQRQECP